MPGEDKPPQQTRQRKRNKKSRSKGKSPGGSPSAHLGGTIDSQDDLLLPPLPRPVPKKPVEEKPKVEEESSIAICLQVLFPYLLAGMGMVMAGMVLDNVQIVWTPISALPPSWRILQSFECTPRRRGVRRPLE
ncbi:solute carrier family 41 member 3-like [Morone saxatilis]|uniref:solute carrier family 41 member 3-like n=1 Tax=Morone saxatilis TaxID=34816 RepID=UPI0015E222B2|nr:solute carrier family 41 member 3-like [Morone saxatilis]